MGILQVASISTTNLTIQGIITATGGFVGNTINISNSTIGNAIVTTLNVNSANITTATATTLNVNILTANSFSGNISVRSGSAESLSANALSSNTFSVSSVLTANSLNASIVNVNGSITSANSEFTSNVFINGSVRSNIVVVPAVDIDCRLGNFFTKTVNTSSTFSFSNVPASRAYSCTLEVTHTTGTITWPGAVRWTLNTAPTLTTGRTHLFMFVTDDGGTIWRGAALVDYTN